MWIEACATSPPRQARAALREPWTMPSVLITGCNTDLSTAFAQQYAQNGSTVYATCRDLAHRLRSDAMRHFALDVTDFAQLDALKHEINAANEQRRVLPPPREGRRHGVLSDISHGMEAYGFANEDTTQADGLAPHIISSDVHSRSVNDKRSAVEFNGNNNHQTRVHLALATTRETLAVRALILHDECGLGICHCGCTWVNANLSIDDSLIDCAEHRNKIAPSAALVVALKLMALQDRFLHDVVNSFQVRFSAATRSLSRFFKPIHSVNRRSPLKEICDAYL